jgi:hypothetical protein
MSEEMKKFREFWIYPYHRVILDKRADDSIFPKSSLPTVYENEFHVIERSAITELESQLKLAVKAIKTVVDDASRPFGEIGGYFISEETYELARETLKKLTGEKPE